MKKRYIPLWSWILNKIEIVIIILQYIKIIIKEMTDSFDNYSENGDERMKKYMEKYMKDREKRKNDYIKFYGEEDIVNRIISKMIIRTGNKADIIKKQQLSAEFKFRLHRETTKTDIPKIKIPKNKDMYELMDKQFGIHNHRGWEGVKFNNYSINETDEIDDLDDLDDISML
jgi:hypothetical protein